MKRWVIGNWKMHLNLAEAMTLAQSIAKFAPDFSHLNIAIAPSLPYLVPIREALKFTPPNFFLASQVVSQWEEGAYTGDVAATQLKKIVSHCLVGHSERRRFHHESGAVVAAQIRALLSVGITPIVCFGEVEKAERSGVTSQITRDLSQDLHGLTNKEIAACLFAYEPLWAISSQKNAQPAEPDYITQIVQTIKVWFRDNYGSEVVILYGGSVTQDNAGALGGLVIIDGVLVGGASIRGKEFHTICTQFAHIVR